MPVITTLRSVDIKIPLPERETEDDAIENLEFVQN